MKDEERKKENVFNRIFLGITEGDSFIYKGKEYLAIGILFNSIILGQNLRGERVFVLRTELNQIKKVEDKDAQIPRKKFADIWKSQTI